MVHKLVRLSDIFVKLQIYSEDLFLIKSMKTSIIYFIFLLPFSKDIVFTAMQVSIRSFVILLHCVSTKGIVESFSAVDIFLNCIALTGSETHLQKEA